VQFADGRKVQAEIAAVNPPYDMALLKVNSSVVTGIRPLPILPAEREASVKVGIPVVALGSPLNQKFMMTQGILSKVDEVTVLGDFLLQAGNSGGPLLNCDGEVIGINTFGESNIAGAIRITVLRALLEAPELMAETFKIQPSPDQLPSVTDRYPVEILNQKVQTEPLVLEGYQIKAGDFTITAITPVLIGKVNVLDDRMRASNRHERRSKGNTNATFQQIDEPYYEWHSSTESALDYAVTFDIRPDSGLTPRSRWSKIFASVFMFGKTGPLEMEFKAEFLEFRLYRDGELIQPIMPGRTVILGDSDPKKNKFIDQAYSGSYVYSPDEFLTGEIFRMVVVDARQPDAVHKELVLTGESPLIQQIRSDFTYIPNFLFLSAPQH
jgi:hypothetical protein